MINLQSLTKKQQIIIAAWVAFSVLYIAYDAWTGFKVGIMENSYIAGKTDTVRALIEQAENKDCKPFNVFVGDKKVDLINMSCIQQSSASSTTSSNGSRIIQATPAQ